MRFRGTASPETGAPPPNPWSSNRRNLVSFESLPSSPWGASTTFFSITIWRTKFASQQNSKIAWSSENCSNFLADWSARCALHSSSKPIFEFCGRTARGLCFPVCAPGGRATTEGTKANPPEMTRRPYANGRDFPS